MKIAVLGYSGSGKSTLTAQLAEQLGFPALHLDQVHWLPGWVEQEPELEREQVKQFLDANSNWVIDGNYLSLWGERRLEEADWIVMLQFSRWTCLKRVVKRRLHHRGESRPSMTQGCPEKLDGEFLRWILFTGRNAMRREGYEKIARQYSEKVRRFWASGELDRWLTGFFKELGTG